LSEVTKNETGSGIAMPRPPSNICLGWCDLDEIW